MILEIDHIKPKKVGGKNNITNLITACKDCNRGKGARLLDDKSVIEKQRQQLEELNERRAQLEMMVKWREELEKLNESTLDVAVKSFEGKACCSITEHGVEIFKKLIRKYPIRLVLDAIDDSCATYLAKDDDGRLTDSSQNKAFKYVSKICNVKSIEKEKPYIKDLFYVRGILRNRLSYLDASHALRLLETAYIGGASIESLKTLAIDCRNWTEWRDAMEEFIKG